MSEIDRGCGVDVDNFVLPRVSLARLGSLGMDAEPVALEGSPSSDGRSMALEQLLPLTDGGLEWQDRAMCAQTDPEAFFPEKGGSTREAKRICTTCPVRTECLQYALDNDERFGIWGGLSERERLHLKRRMK